MAGVALQATPNGVLLDEFGNTLAGRLVYVYQRDTTTTVTVYSDEALTHSVTQPLTTQSDGSIPGYVNDASAPLDYFATATSSRVQGLSSITGPAGPPGGAGLSPSGGDDTSAINTAIAAGGMLGVGTFKVSAAITGIPRGQGPSLTTLQATNAAARIQIGPNLGTLPTSDTGTYGGFTFDGNSLVTGAALLLNTSGTTLEPIVIINCLGDGLIVAGQNCSIHEPDIAFMGGAGIVYDNGCGNNKIFKPQVSRCATYHHESRQSAAPPVGAYAVPTYNTAYDPQYEYGSGSNLGCYHQLAGSFNSFVNANFFTSLDVSLVKIQPNTVSGRSGDANGRLYFQGVSTFSGNNTGVGVGIEANAVSGGVAGALNADVAIVFLGERIFSGLNVAQKWGVSNAVWARGPITKYNVTTEFQTNGTGAYASVLNVGLSAETFPDDIVVTRNEFIGGYQQITKYTGSIAGFATNNTRMITVDPAGDGSTIGRNLWLPDGSVKVLSRKDLPDAADQKTLYGQYKMVIPWWGGADPQSTVGGTFVLAPTTIIAAASNGSPIGMVYVDPADFGGWGTLNYRVKAVVATNATAPTVSFTFGLYPVSAVAGGTNVNTLTLGTVVSGSTVLFTTPAASSQLQADSGDFAAPGSAGYYALAVVSSGTTAASSSTMLRACLQQHRK